MSTSAVSATDASCNNYYAFKSVRSAALKTLHAIALPHSESPRARHRDSVDLPLEVSKSRLVGSILRETARSKMPRDA